MVRKLIPIVLLLASVGAAAQSGVTLSSGPGAGIVSNPVVIAPLAPGDLDSHIEAHAEGFTVTRLDGLAATSVPGTEPRRTPDPTTMLLGEQPIVTIEEDGVRLPEQRLDTVLH